jgi:glycine cleavage system H protein
MSIPNDLKYTKDHEWAKVEGNIVTIGITDHAQSSLGDVVYTELPEEGREVTKGETFGVVESVKAVSDLYSPVTGKITAANESLADEPHQINEDPYGKAWIIKVEVTDPATLEDLLDASAYSAYVASL